jgi:hypothetical protein
MNIFISMSFIESRNWSVLNDLSVFDEIEYKLFTSFAEVLLLEWTELLYWKKGSVVLHYKWKFSEKLLLHRKKKQNNFQTFEWRIVFNEIEYRVLSLFVEVFYTE